MNNDVPVETSKKFWLIWSPESDTPPRTSYTNWGAVKRAAQMLAAKFPDQQFYIMESRLKGLPATPDDGLKAETPAPKADEI